MDIEAAVTGIGSLPFTDAEEAVEFVTGYAPIVPFWPQLPRRSPAEGMIAQGLASCADLLQKQSQRYTVRGGQLDAFLERLDTTPTFADTAHAAGFFAFERALHAGHFPQARAVKGQVTGPLTLAAALCTAEVPFLHQPDLIAALGRYVTRWAQWQVTRLGRAGVPVLLFVDEPALPLLTRYDIDAAPSAVRAVVRDVLHGIRAAGAVAGLHCCVPRALPLMLAMQPDILAFDAYEAPEVLAQLPHFTNFLRRGGTVAYGMVPTDPARARETAESLFARWSNAVAPCGPMSTVARQSLVTATCGLGLLQEDAAHRIFQTTQHVARLMQRAADAGGRVSVQGVQQRQDSAEESIDLQREIGE
jgi:hypothetical protein